MKATDGAVGGKENKRFSEILKFVMSDPVVPNGLGYVKLSVDTFGSRDLGNCQNSRPFACGKGGVSKMVNDACGAIEHLSGPPFVKSNEVAVMGFSMGGHAVNSIATYRRPSPSRRTFIAGIAMYGSCEYLYNVSKETMPVVEIIGEHDSYAPGVCLLAKVRRLRFMCLPMPTMVLTVLLGN